MRIEIRTELERQFSGSAGFLLPYFRDPAVTDILVQGHFSLYVERSGKLEPERNYFENASQLTDLIERLLLPLGKRIDAALPYCDGRLSDGTRFHLLLPPLAVEGPFISFRKFSSPENISLENFATPEVTQWLRSQLTEKSNLLISGKTGAGKTTLLNCLLNEISGDERILVLEETREIHTRHPHSLHLEARAATPDGCGEVTLSQLVKNSLRMRPDRIIVGECRGAEAYEMLQAMSTGHAGSIGTLHANSAREALRRFESLVAVGRPSLPLRVVREWIAHSVQLVIHLERGQGGRRIAEVLGVAGLEGDLYRLHPHLKRTGQLSS